MNDLNMRGRQQGITPEDVLYGHLQRNQKPSRSDCYQHVDIGQGWIMEEWIGSNDWMVNADITDVPKEWLAGSSVSSFPMRHPDQDSLHTIQALDNGMQRIADNVLPCHLEEIPSDDPATDSQEQGIRILIEYKSFGPVGAERRTTAAAIRAVETLAGSGEWRYSLRLSELVYVSGDQILGTVWIGPESLLH